MCVFKLDFRLDSLWSGFSPARMSSRAAAAHETWDSDSNRGSPLPWRKPIIPELCTLNANSVPQSLWRCDNPSQCCKRPRKGGLHPPCRDLDNLGSFLGQVTQPPNATLSTSRKVGQSLHWPHRAMKGKRLNICNSFHQHMINLQWILDIFLIKWWTLLLHLCVSLS